MRVRPSGCPGSVIAPVLSFTWLEFQTTVPEVTPPATFSGRSELRVNIDRGSGERGDLSRSLGTRVLDYSFHVFESTALAELKLARDRSDIDGIDLHQCC